MCLYVLGGRGKSDRHICIKAESARGTPRGKQSAFLSNEVAPFWSPNIGHTVESSKENKCL